MTDLTTLLRGAAFDPETLAKLDETEEFPAEACAALDDFGLPGYYVPAEHGGALRGFDEVAVLLREVAGRDLTVAVAHGKTYLGAVATWIAGEPAAAARLGERIRAGAVVSCALTERTHGSDLLGGEVTARPLGDGWTLDGEKWLINNATRAELVTVLARTDPGGGPRGFTLFLLDKTRLEPGALTPSPKVPTYGVRGADISGIVLREARVGADAVIGPVGHGIEIILKALHITRTACVAMSLGAGDQALELAGSFARETVVDGRPLAGRPEIQQVLADAAAALDLASAAATVAVRAITGLPRELSVHSAVAKAFVPAQVDDLIARLTGALGPYGLLSADFRHGAFAKLERDARIIGIFDGSSLVNRNSLIDQFRRLSRAWRKGEWNVAGLTEVTTPDAAPSPFRPGALSLVTDGNSVLTALPGAAREVRALASGRLTRLVDRLVAATTGVHEEMAAMTIRPHAVPPVAFELAERYELCFAAAAGIHLWLREPRPADETRLVALLERALAGVGAQ
uniref:Acyl-CoA dehydrogenase n=1 Tax=uncultured bacterium esnapd3.1 TaxID=1366608 RepID=S5TLZ6_9BACT|nr:hypothetical protein [uncultured bacterium esnapd3.1]